MKFGIVMGWLALVATATAAPSFDDYLALRRQHGVAISASQEALETFVGSRVMEVRGIVKGSIGSGDTRSLLLETKEGRTLNIKAAGAPDWVTYPNTTARLLVKAERRTELGLLRAELLGAASEDQMLKFEAAENARLEQQRQAALARQQAAERNQRGGTTSRGGRPPALPGNIPSLSVATRTNLAPELNSVLGAYAGFIRSRNSRLSVAQATDIAAKILEHSARFGVDARLIMAIVLVESNFNPNAVSHAGARGLGQLMPGTARGLGVSNVFDTDQNLMGTAKLITQHLSTYSRNNDEIEALVLSLAAYNAGPGAVRRFGGVPPYRETQNYVKKVMSTYRQLCGQPG